MLSTQTHSKTEVNQRWLDAYSDPRSYLYTISRCMTLADLQGDGDNKLVLADLGTGTANIKLKVYKGTSLINENTLLEIPTALASFYHDHQEQKIPSIAVASGSSIYIYKNMKPYYKFSLPDLQLHPLEMDLWIQARNDEISPSVLYSMLESIKNEIGFSNLSHQSQKLLMQSLDNEEELRNIITTHASQTIKRQTVITCMCVLFKNSSANDSISYLVIGTESGWIYIIDTESFTILDSVNQSAGNLSTDQTVPVVIKTIGLYDVEYRVIIYNRNGKVTLLRRGWTEPKTILQLSIQVVDMCLASDTGNIFLALMDSSFECYTKKGKKLWSIKLAQSVTGLLTIPLPQHGLTLIAVALKGGCLCFYNGRELVDTIMAADTIAGMVFGRFGQGENCLVLITISGVFQVKVLKRTAVFTQQSSSATSRQALKLKIPKKTNIFLEHANREINQSIEIHRTYQKELLQFRLDATREYCESLNRVNNSISNDSRLPLKLSTEVFGLGPTFKILLTLENMTQGEGDVGALLSKTISIVLHYDDRIYRVERPYMRAPLLVPGLAYKFDTKVHLATETTATDDIHVFVVSSDDTRALISAVVNMPVCDVLPMEI